MGFLDLVRNRQKKDKKPYTVYDAFAGFDKVAEAKRVTLETRVEKLEEEEAKLKEKLKKVQAEINDTKTFLRHGLKEV